MKHISNFMLQEHTNSLYKNEAMSSISLTKDVANKINELVDAYNELAKMDLEWKQLQEGTIRKGVIYMKDNLINSLNDLMTQLNESGFVDDRIRAYTIELSNNINNLTARLNNLLGSVTSGSTSMDSEIIDGRVGADNKSYTTIGEATRKNLKMVFGERVSNVLNLALNINIIEKRITLGRLAPGLSVIFGEKKRYHFDDTFNTISLDISTLETSTYNVVFNSRTGYIRLVELSMLTNATPQYEYDDYILATLYMGSDSVREYVNIIDGFVYENGIPLTSGNVPGRHYNSFSILGDSYSSYDGFMNPTSNRSWYPNVNNDVVSVTQCWWHLFANEYQSALIQNNSFTGSTISYDGYASGTTDGKAESFVTRVKNIANAELLIIFGGTNDSAVPVTLGSYKYSNWSESDFESFRPSLAYLLDYLKKYKPGAKLLYVLNTGLSNDFVTSVETICNYYGVDLLKLSNIDKQDSHPSVLGMQQIKNQIIAHLNS